MPKINKVISSCCLKQKYFLFTAAIIFLLLISACLPCLFSVFNKNVTKPNILLVTVCSLRQDHLGCYGYSRNTSPAIDKFARGSVCFKNCYTHIPWTKPSVLALMTGKYPGRAKTGIKETSLVSFLDSMGYITYGIVGTNMARDAAKMNLGFESFFDNYNLKISKDIHTVQADTIVDKAIELLEVPLPKKTPIFLWLFFKDPHWPYMPPTSYKEKFLHDPLYSEQLQQLVINKDYNNSIGGIGEARLKDNAGQLITNRAYYIAQYDAEICFLDSQINRIFEYLQRHSNFDNWLIVLLADHGESLGEDNYYFDHGYFLSEGLIKIPLFMKLPLQTKQKIRYDLASICDIFPTIAALVGMPTRDLLTMNLFGKSLFSKETWLTRQYQRRIMIENSNTHESGNIKLLGCIELPYKFIHIVAEKADKLYDISKQEVLITNYNKQQYIIKDRIKKYITDFWISLDKAFQTNKEELKSLGYLQ